MYNPWSSYVRFHQSILEGMGGMAKIMMESYLRLARQQQEVLMKTFDHRRAEDGKAKPSVVPSGPDLTDHYGRRSRDIDVEKDV
ncbi:MAG: hypothetical protein H7841_07235 [Magnetospirillum sp. WYHS-4]